MGQLIDKKHAWWYNYNVRNRQQTKSSSSVRRMPSTLTSLRVTLKF